MISDIEKLPNRCSIALWAANTASWTQVGFDTDSFIVSTTVPIYTRAPVSGYGSQEQFGGLLLLWLETRAPTNHYAHPLIKVGPGGGVNQPSAPL